MGCNVLRVVDAFPDRFSVVGLAAGGNVERLAEQVARYRPRVVSVATAAAGEDLGRRVDISGLRIGLGEEGSVSVAPHRDAQLVVAAAVGAVGLVPTYRALEAGKDVALANKETLVMAGELVTRAAREGGGEIVPVDSEHSAVLQCLGGHAARDVSRLILTASGGPFRSWDPEHIAHATVDQALQHPTWKMGRKITVDSATLVNKALEVIEAHFLFGLGLEQVEVVVHPQSVVHALVEFVDGSVLSQLGFPNMELPILYALTHPERVSDRGPRRFDALAAGTITFEPVSPSRFPAYALGRAAGAAGGTTPAVFNAANEVAVQLFLEGRIRFGGIAEIIERVLARHDGGDAGSLEAVLAADADARRQAREVVCP